MTTLKPKPIPKKKPGRPKKNAAPPAAIVIDDPGMPPDVPAQVEQHGPAPVPVSTFQSADLLINQAIAKDVDINKLEKLLTLKGKYEAEENKKQFQAAFSALQSELPVIEKTKTVRNGRGEVMYKYAPLEKIIEQIKPYLKRHGFSYKWSEGAADRDGYKRIICTIMACGHEESSYIDMPVLSATKTTNQAQAAGSTSTYGKRYSLIGALGIMADEDDDGRGAGPTGPQPAPQPAPQQITPEQEKDYAIERFRLKYRELAKFTTPNQKLTEFADQIAMKTTKEIKAGANGIDALIKKYANNTQG